MLYEFLHDNRSELILRCREKVATRPARESGGDELTHGITLFLDQLIKTLLIEQPQRRKQSQQSLNVSGASGGIDSVSSEIGASAAQHGWELLRHGFTVEQVVHDYGDLCQAIMELAVEKGAYIEVEEYHTLNRCLDNATADAVTEYNTQDALAVADRHSQELNQQLNQRLGMLAHELRNLITTAMIAQDLIKNGHVAMNGATGAVLERSLLGLRSLVDRSLSEVRMSVEMSSPQPAQNQRFSLAEFIAEVKITSGLEAQVRGCTLSVSSVDPQLAVDADRDLLFSAVGNLLQNAFKFTRPETEVTLRAYSSAERIFIEVEDRGEGLPPGQEETMFKPFTQGGQDKSGLGLGLSIAKRSVEANGGTLRVGNKPALDSGCIFTIDLPRHLVTELDAPTDAPLGE